jgi:hypothetical protein
MKFPVKKKKKKRFCETVLERIILFWAFRKIRNSKQEAVGYDISGETETKRWWGLVIIYLKPNY